MWACPKPFETLCLLSGCWKKWSSLGTSFTPQLHKFIAESCKTTVVPWDCKQSQVLAQNQMHQPKTPFLSGSMLQSTSLCISLMQMITWLMCSSDTVKTPFLEHCFVLQGLQSLRRGARHFLNSSQKDRHLFHGGISSSECQIIPTLAPMQSEIWVQAIHESKKCSKTESCHAQIQPKFES